mmetsp:Transcript_58827/g.154951  ORF Transcript_58827/g.154951 Transcript_58827/m.154951 type:complete len:318 (+) Transcript_58827:134-1087(+)
MPANAADVIAKIKTIRLMTAIKTPYKADGDIDLEAFDKHCEHQIANGVDALIIGGTTGEGHLMSWDEHLFLIAHVKAKFGDKFMIVGNTGTNHTGEAVYATKKGFAAGMDCALLINPYYGKTSDKGIVMHIEATLKFGPGIIYNVPGRTGQDIKPEVIMQLAANPNFVGVKECMGHERIELLSKKGVACWSGNDDEAHVSTKKHGGVGVISVTSNIVPALMHKLMYGDLDEALDAKMQPLFKWLFEEPNPIAVNTLMMQMGCCSPVFRLPYTHRSQDKRVAIVEIMAAIGNEHTPSGKAPAVLEDSDFKHTLGGGEA